MESNYVSQQRTDHQGGEGELRPNGAFGLPYHTAMKAIPDMVKIFRLSDPSMSVVTEKVKSEVEKIVAAALRRSLESCIACGQMEEETARMVVQEIMDNNEIQLYIEVRDAVKEYINGNRARIGGNEKTGIPTSKIKIEEPGDLKFDVGVMIRGLSYFFGLILILSIIAAFSSRSGN